MPDLFGSKEPVATNTYSRSFERFWSEYPKFRRKAKKDAFKIWQRDGLEKLETRILQDLQERKAGDKTWQKDGGKFVPLPTTYLNGSRWEDVIESERAEAFKPRHVAEQGPRQEDRYKAAINRLWFNWRMNWARRGKGDLSESVVAAQLAARDVLADDLRNGKEPLSVKAEALQMFNEIATG